MRVLHHIAECIAVLLAAVSCGRQEMEPAGRNEPVSLTFAVSLPNVSISTRSNSMYDDEASFGKIVTDPFGTSLEGWTLHEQLIDARALYRLTIFLVDRESGALVGYRDLYDGSPDMTSDESDTGKNGWGEVTTASNGEGRSEEELGTSAVVTFNYDHPLHRAQDGTSSESLSRGPFRIIAVANWGPAEFTLAETENDVYSYAGLVNHADGKEGETFESYVNSVIREFNSLKSASEVRRFNTYEKYHDLMDFALVTDSEDFLCELTVQPLTLVRDFDLQPGRNTISGQLTRCWARVRVSVENVSKSDLTVQGLSFSETARDKSYMFFASGKESESLVDPPGTEYGSPKILSEESEQSKPRNSLVMVTEKVVIPGWQTPEDNCTKILFDGYILPTNGKNETFSYDIDLEYVGKKSTHLMRAKKADGKWDCIEDNPNAIEDGGLYVMQSRRSGSKVIIYAGTDRLQTTKDMLGSNGFISDEFTKFSEEFVFRFVRDTGTPEVEVDGRHRYEGQKMTFPRFWIQTFDGKYWVGTPTQNKENIRLVPTIPTAYIVRNDGMFNADKNLSNLVFWSTVEDPNNAGVFNYINIDGGNSSLIKGWMDGYGGDGKLYPGDDDGSQFQLTKVNEETRDAMYRNTITLATIDPVTAVQKPVTAINRNDFINIYITASYNDRSGDFEFTVKDWNTGGGDIEFN